MPEHPIVTTRRAALTLAAAVAAASLIPRAGLAADVQERILIIGDSQAQGLAGGVQRLYRSDRSRKVFDMSKISTGLMPRANYDWPAQAKTIVGNAHYDVALMLIGANDRPPVHVGGHVDPDRLATFTDSYGAKVASIADDFKQASIPLIWVGHPIVRDPAWSEDAAILNTVFATYATGEGATFFPTWDMFKGPDGGFTQYGKGLDGVTTRLRQDDGVHLTPAGYDILANALAATLDHYRPVSPISSPVSATASAR